MLEPHPTRVPSIAVAESLTCGHLQSLIGAISGASAYFSGGVTAYTLEQKVSLLGVDRDHAEANACVSERVAREMALGVRRLFRSEIGLATTGFAERAPGVPQPFAWWALAGSNPEGGTLLLSGKVEFPGRSRTEVQAAVARHVHGVWCAHLASMGIQFPATSPQRA